MRCSAGRFRDVKVEESRATFTTEQMIAEVRGGVITRLFNRATGTEYLSPSQAKRPQELSTALVYVAPATSEHGQTPNVVGATPTAAGAQILVPSPLTLAELPNITLTQTDTLAVEYICRSPADHSTLTVSYSLDPESGDLLVKQKAVGTRGHLSAIRFGIGPVVCRGNLLLPVFHGIKANRTDTFYEFEGTRWEWPMGWPIPLLIFDDALGGFWIHTQDTERRFKAFEYRYEGAGTWLVAFDTVNPAPFAPHTCSESVTWRINTYAGDWGAPVDRYKSWAYTAYRVQDKAFARPAWVDDISLVVKHADYVEEKHAERYLDMLAEHVAPSRTLLFMTAWSESGTAVIPNWVASEKGARFNEAARKRCFRTMYFANYIGITPNHPRFAEFAPHFIRNPYTQDVEGWNLKGEWSAATDMQLYYVSPAHKSWRDYQIGQFRALFDAHPADGLFIDQSFLMFNDGNGLVNGHTTVDGNLDYHRELAEAIPGVAIGGEGINEITFQYESFCELHFLSLHLATDTGGREPGMGIDPGAFDRMVPIMPRFLLPHTRPIGYLAFPETHSPFYEAWRDAVHFYHGIPTITRPSVVDICDPDSEVRRVIREAFGMGQA